MRLTSNVARCNAPRMTLNGPARNHPIPGRQALLRPIRVAECEALETESEAEAPSVADAYNREMALKMGWMDNPFEYHPERGLYYHFISPDIVVGSQPRQPSDIIHLAEERGVQAIVNLQQDKDLHHWNVNVHDLQHAARERGVQYIRTPAVDFDPNSLRSTLPSAVASVERSRLEHGVTYVHCTAGLGRAPAVAIAQLYWMTDMQLDEAYEYLTGIRPCGPNRDAIRGATYDLLSGQHWDGFQHLPGHAFATLSSWDRDVIREKLLGSK